MDNDLLKQLILRNKRIVIPEFGAFIKKEDTGGDVLVFSPFLRKDDGVVTDAIVREYGVDTDDARAMVAEFVLYLKQSLSSGRYYIDGIGMLVSDANGTVILKEHETPEPDPVSIEPIIESIQPIQQPVVSRVAVPNVAPAIQRVTRAQSIQVQSSVAPAPQPTVPNFPSIQHQSQQPVIPVVPSKQRSSVSQGGYSGIQQPVVAQYQPPRSPMMTSHPHPLQKRPMPAQPMASQYISGQQPISQQPVPVQGKTIVPTLMPQQSMVGSVPPRGQHDPRRVESSDEERPNDGMRQGASGSQQQRRQRPPQRRRRPPKPKTKADVWLIFAIVAAMAVVGLMVYAVLTDNGADSMEMINSAMSPVNSTPPPVADSTAVIDVL